MEDQADRLFGSVRGGSAPAVRPSRPGEGRSQRDAFREVGAVGQPVGGELDQVHVSAEDFAAALLESDFYDALIESAPNDDEVEQLDEALQNITGDISVAVYVSDGNILFVVGVSVNGEPTFLSDFCSEAGVADPTDMPSSEAVTEAIIDTLDDYAALFTARSDYSLYGF